MCQFSFRIRAFAEGRGDHQACPERTHGRLGFPSQRHPSARRGTRRHVAARAWLLASAAAVGDGRRSYRAVMTPRAQ